MFRSYRIGRLLGFDIEVNLSFLIMLGLFVLWSGLLAGVVLVVLAFGSVLLHELGHALVARHLGVRVAGIELHFFGGAAKLAGQPKSAGDEITIAAAGPAVSFALGGVGMVLATLTGWYVLLIFGWINLIMGVFNLIPALPMDGGRIFRAALSKRMGFVRATEVSVTVARGVAIAMGLVALFTLQLYLLLLAVVLWIMGSAELQLARHAGYGHTAARVEVMPRGFRVGGPQSGGRETRVHRPVATGGFVIRQRGGRFVIEFLD
jgi:Zn-dependent protease